MIKAINYLWVLFYVFSSHEMFADEIVLVADGWCPYNCSTTSKLPGFMVEIAQLAFATNSDTVKYVTVPWARAIHGVREGQYHGIIGAGKDETPDFIFPDIEFGLANHTFFVINSSQWKFNGIASLEKITLGVIKDYSYGNLFDDYIKPNQSNSKRIQIISNNGGLQLNIDKLLNRKVDAIVEDKTVFHYYLFANDIQNRFLSVGSAGDEKVYIAFSPKFEYAQKYADLLTTNMKKLRVSGQLAEILEKYGLSDWYQ